MWKLLIIICLLTLCALLEAPEDYQLTSNATHIAVLSGHDSSGRAG